VYIAYREACYSKKFAVTYADDLALHMPAKAYFNILGTKKLPVHKELRLAGALGWKPTNKQKHFGDPRYPA